MPAKDDPMKRRSLFLLAALAWLPAWAQPAQHIVLTSAIEQVSAPKYRLLLLIYTEAFRQLGIGVQFRTVPAARAMAEAQAGNLDGELARGLEYESMQSSLVRVPEPAIIAALGAYARDPAIHLSSIEELRGASYRVECHSGYPVIEKMLTAVIPSSQLSRISHTELGLRKVALGRTDIYIDAEDLVDPILAARPPELQEVYKVGVMERKAIYAYLHRRHARLAERLGEVLRHMRASGQIEQLRLQAEQQAASPREAPH